MDKLINVFFSVENDFFRYVLVIIGVYVAQTLFKISKVRKDGTFDWRELINGILDYAIYFVGVLIFFFAGMLIKDVKIIPLQDKYLTVDDALTLLAYVLMTAQCLKCFRNIKETFDIHDEQLKEINDKLATIPVGKEG